MTAMLGQSTVVCGSSRSDPVFALGSMPKCRYFPLLALRLVLSTKVPSEGVPLGVCKFVVDVKANL